MTSPQAEPPAQALGESLAAQVAALRGQVTLISQRLDRAGLRGDLDLAARFEELARNVADALDAAAPHAPAAPCGTAGPATSTPSRNYPPLAAAWHHTYGGQRLDLARALELYDRWLPGTMRRIAHITRTCVPECATHHRPGDGLGPAAGSLVP
jgi:hypothetical protein